MKKIKLLLFSFTLLIACDNPIKNEEAKVEVEEGTKVDSNQSISEEAEPEDEIEQSPETYWVGFFNPHKDVDLRDKYIYADEGLMWARGNKISISIDSILGDSVIGHSVVAGNHRPFYGRSAIVEGTRRYKVKEPGDHKHDGIFQFEISDNRIIGTWESYQDLEIPKREFNLEMKSYAYNPDIMLERRTRYGDWNKFIDHGTNYEIVDEGTPDEEIYEWIVKEYASSTEVIYEINASNTLLKKKDVENLSNSDLVVIRNTIYARHGYSFSFRPLRVFFDAQDWYIPVHADIKSGFTTIEKENIQLLLRYEKNAKEYYDYFGRG